MTASTIEIERPDDELRPEPRSTPAALPRLLGVATANPPNRYSQRELLDLLKITDAKIRGVFLNGGIETRYLTLPPRDHEGAFRIETQGELLAKHRTQGVRTGAAAVRACLRRIGRDIRDVRYLVAVTTTGFLTPGLSALLINELGLDPDTARLDVVGMGCNAGLNGLAAVSNWAATHPDELALLVCSEACSAAYVFDGTMRTAVVNSLFGDGAAALAVRAGGDTGATAPGSAPAPALVTTSSYMIRHAVGAMRYDWDEDAGKFSFYLDKEVPYEVGAHAEIVIDKLLRGTGLRRKDIAHWTVHSGGKKVIDAVKINLGLTSHDLRHTASVMRDFGNLSSGSFLFSYQRLLEEGKVRRGDHGVLMTMGPGSQIESALLQF
ncbi:(3,5-dihydroxycyclohex-3-enyl)acetyl-CoA synthase [Nocardia amikacinitolerans]|uniref:3,5-dihydroxyphenylacetyl-CoA synthase DpgA n=1 Tax=Nocardia amikacinitolerans TaxID=756689 RepID=UPI00082A34FE|nr:3,5-dihydroxyphenylacetyl-CoA synthase DpgA [Nocardia amikacinitolerans]MCP2319979.1 (3,5-dihydroxycyclohex-3-enyl)acetyl-CoA synthase [Nocardia amikacinitolerans]